MCWKNFATEKVRSLIIHGFLYFGTCTEHDLLFVSVLMLIDRIKNNIKMDQMVVNDLIKTVKIKPNSTVLIFIEFLIFDWYNFISLHEMKREFPNCDILVNRESLCFYAKSCGVCQNIDSISCKSTPAIHGKTLEFIFNLYKQMDIKWDTYFSFNFDFSIKMDRLTVWVKYCLRLLIVVVCNRFFPLFGCHSDANSKLILQKLWKIRLNVLEW